MRYRVEYLLEARKTDSVCHAMDTDGSLEESQFEARVASAVAMMKFGARGFQIRDLTENGRIVAGEAFDNPLWRFGSEADDKVIN